jgi:hypothetical protein
VVVVALAGCGRFAFDPFERAGDAQASDAPPLTAGDCPPSYMFVGGGCYRVAIGGATDWLANEQACEADAVGAHLVVIDDIAEAQTLRSITPDTNVDVWAGATDLVVEGTWRTVTSRTPAFLTWDPGEPDNNTQENCLYFNTRVVNLSSGDCTNGDDFICEFDGVAAVPAAWGQ